MTEPRSPLDTALDVFVFIPLGIAATAAEELPKLAAKGRAEVSGRLTVARMVGEFAVAQGRKEVTRRVGQMGSPVAGPDGASGDRWFGPPASRPEPRRFDDPEDRWPQDPDDPISAGPISADPVSAGPISAGSTSAPIPADPISADPVATSDPPTTDLASDGSGPDASGLAIPGYDSLSASQVIQRLAGLSRDELTAVGEYESAHRARRTVLTRVSQLQDS
jgi:hypothetical protein